MEVQTENSGYGTIFYVLIGGAFLLAAGLIVWYFLYKKSSPKETVVDTSLEDRIQILETGMNKIVTFLSEPNEKPKKQVKKEPISAIEEPLDDDTKSNFTEATAPEELE